MREYTPRHNPALTRISDMAKRIGLPYATFYYRVNIGDIPDGDVITRRKRFYSAELADKITQQWKTNKGDK